VAGAPGVAGVAVVGAALGVGALQAASPAAQVPVRATKSITVLRERTADRLAQAALEACQAKGFPVSVVIVDRDGIEVVVKRDEDATGATVATAIGKATASAGFRSPSGALGEAAKSNPGLLTVPDFVLLAGGEPITTSSGEILGGIGVSGRTDEEDQEIAEIGARAASVPAASRNDSLSPTLSARPSTK
jgi:uncharacterized protein GlcG (DUF336 family)